MARGMRQCAPPVERSRGGSLDQPRPARLAAVEGVPIWQHHWSGGRDRRQRGAIAERDQLRRVPRIGPKAADAIVAARRHTAVCDVGVLRQLGIGAQATQFIEREHPAAV